MQSGKDDSLQSPVGSAISTGAPDSALTSTMGDIIAKEGMPSDEMLDSAGDIMKTGLEDQTFEKADLIKAELAGLRAELGLLAELTEVKKDEERAATPPKHKHLGRHRRAMARSHASSSRSSDSEGGVSTEARCGDEGFHCGGYHSTVAPRRTRRRGAGLVLAKQFAKRVLLHTFGNPRRGGPANVSRPLAPRAGRPSSGTGRKVTDAVDNSRVNESENEEWLEGDIVGPKVGNSPTDRRSVQSDDDGWMEVNDEASSEASSVNGEESSDRDSVFKSPFEGFQRKDCFKDAHESDSSAASERPPELEATLMGAPEAPQLGQFLLPLLTSNAETEARSEDGRGITLIHDRILEILSSTEEQMNVQRNSVPNSPVEDSQVPDCQESFDIMDPYTKDFDHHLGVDQMMTDMLESMQQGESETEQKIMDPAEDVYLTLEMNDENPSPFNREYDLDWWTTMACALSALGGAGAVVVAESDTKWGGLLKLPCLCCHCRNKKTHRDTLRQNLSLVISVMKMHDNTARQAELLEAMLQPALCVCSVFYTNVEGVSQSCHRCMQSSLAAKIEELRSSVEAWRHLSQLVTVITSNEQLTRAAESSCCCERKTPAPVETVTTPIDRLPPDDQIRRAVAFFVSGIRDTSYFKLDVMPSTQDAPKSRAMRFLDHLQKNSRLKIAPLRHIFPTQWSPPCPHCTCSCATVRLYKRSECKKALNDALQRMNSLAVTAGLPHFVHEEVIPELAVMLTESRAATIATCSSRDTVHKLLTDLVIGCEWSCGIHLLKSPQIIFDANVCTAYAVFTTLLARRFIEIACNKFPKAKRGLTLMITGENFDLFSSFVLARAFMVELTTYNDSYLTLDDVCETEFDERLTNLINILSINTTGTEIISMVQTPVVEVCNVKVREKNIANIEKFIAEVKASDPDDERNTSDELELELLHTMDYLIKTAKSLVSLMYVVLNHAGLPSDDESSRSAMSLSLTQAYLTMEEFRPTAPLPPLRCCGGGHELQDWRCLNRKLLEFDSQVEELYLRMPSIHRAQTRAIDKLLDILKKTYPVGVGVTLSSLRYCHTSQPLLSRAKIVHQTYTPQQAQRMLAWLVYSRVLGHELLFEEVRQKVVELQEQYEVFVRLRLFPLLPLASVSECGPIRADAGSKVPPTYPFKPVGKFPAHEQHQRAGKRKFKPTKSEETTSNGGRVPSDIFYFNNKGKQDHRPKESAGCFNKGQEISMSMRECIAKFAKISVNGKRDDSIGDHKDDCQSPPLADVPESKKDADSKLLFRTAKGPLRIGQTNMFPRLSDLVKPVSESRKGMNLPDDCDPIDLMLLETVASLEDKEMDKLIEGNTTKQDLKPKDEHCKMKCCQNENGNIFEKIFNTLMVMNKSVDGKPVLNGEVLVAKCMQEAMKFSDLPDDVKGVPRILLAIMPEVAAKLAELVSISTELPEFGSLICSLSDCIEDSQSLSPETIKQLKELRMSRSDASKVTKSKWKNKKNKQHQHEECTEASADSNKGLMDILREEIEKEVQTFFKVKDRSKEEQNVFSLWAKWMVIDKILDHVKQFVGENFADKHAGLEAWRDILPKLKDLQSLSIETISTLKKLAFKFPKVGDDGTAPTEENKPADASQPTSKSKKGFVNNVKSHVSTKDNGLSIEHLILCSSPDKGASNEKVSKIILEMNNVQSKSGIRPDGFDETKQAYFIEKLQAINKNYVEKLHKRNFTSEDWIMTMNELQELERKLKTAFTKPLASQTPQKQVETREAELVAGKGLSKLINKSSKRPEKQEGVQKTPQKTADRSADDAKAFQDSSAHADNKNSEIKCEPEDSARKGQLLARCEEMLKCKGDKSLLDSFYSIKKYMSQGEPVPDKYMEQVFSICSSIDPKLLVDWGAESLTKRLQTQCQMQHQSDSGDCGSERDADKEQECETCQPLSNGCQSSSHDSDSCAHGDDGELSCCDGKGGGRHIAIIGSQNPEEVAKYTAMALRRAKQSLNASAFPQNGNEIPLPTDPNDTGGCCTGKRCRRTQTQAPKATKEPTPVLPAEAKASAKPPANPAAPATTPATAAPARNGKKCDSANNSGHHYICRVGHVEIGGSGCGGGGGSHSCNCCYCAVYGHAPPQTSPVSKSFNETRERLRSILFKKKQQTKPETGTSESDTGATKASSACEESSSDEPPPVCKIHPDTGSGKAPIEGSAGPQEGVFSIAKAKETASVAVQATDPQKLPVQTEQKSTPQVKQPPVHPQPKQSAPTQQKQPVPAPQKQPVAAQQIPAQATQKPPGGVAAPKCSERGPAPGAYASNAAQDATFVSALPKQSVPVQQKPPPPAQQKQPPPTKSVPTAAQKKQPAPIVLHAKIPTQAATALVHASRSMQTNVDQTKGPRGAADGRPSAATSPSAHANCPKLNPSPASSRDVSVSSVSSGCFSYTTLCNQNGHRRSVPLGGQTVSFTAHNPLPEDPRDLDELLQYIEGPTRVNDKSKKRAKKARQKARKEEIRLMDEMREARASALQATEAVLKVRGDVETLRNQFEEARRNVKRLRKAATPQGGPQATNSKKKGKKGIASQANTQAASNVDAALEELSKLTFLLSDASKQVERAEAIAQQSSIKFRQAQMDLMATVNSSGGNSIIDEEYFDDDHYRPCSPDEPPPEYATRIVNQTFLKTREADGTFSITRIDGQTLALMSNGTKVPLSEIVMNHTTGEYMRQETPAPAPPKKQSSAPTSWEAAMAQINAVAKANAPPQAKKTKEKKKADQPTQAPAASVPPRPSAADSQPPAPPKKAPPQQHAPETKRKKLSEPEVDTSKLSKKERKALARKAEEAARLEEDLKEAAKKQKEKAKRNTAGKENSKQTKSATVDQSQQKKGKKGAVEAPSNQTAKNQGKQGQASVQPEQTAKAQKGAGKQVNQQTGKKQQQTQPSAPRPPAKAAHAYNSAARASDHGLTSLSRRLDTSLKLNSDTTIEMTNSRKNSMPHSNMRNSPTACSIMEQLSSGVQVADLKLPPGITLTRVDPSKHPLNPIKSIPMPTKTPILGPTLPKPLTAHSVIHAEPPPPTCFPPLPVSVPVPQPDMAPLSKKKNKKKNNKKAAEPAAAPPSQMVTLRNPLYHPDKPTVSVAMQCQDGGVVNPAPNVLRIPDPIPMPPTAAACRATITPAPNGMFTIRSPMLSAAAASAAMQRDMSTPPSAMPSHLMPTMAPSRDRCYSLFDGNKEAGQQAMVNGVATEPVQPKQQEPIGTPARRSTVVPEPSGLYSLFSSPHRQQPVPPEVDDSLPYFQRLRAGARLNNEVTIHHVSESKYYRPSYGNISETPHAPPTAVEISVAPQQPTLEPYPTSYRAPVKMPSVAPWNFTSPSTSSSSLSSSLENAARVVPPSAANSLYGSVCNSTSNSPAQQASNESAACLPLNVADGWASWTTQPEPVIPVEPWTRPAGSCATPTDPRPTAQFGPIGSHRPNYANITTSSMFSDCGPQYPNHNDLDLDSFKRYDYYMEPSTDRLRNSLSAMHIEK